MIKSIKAITSYFFNLVNRTGRRKLLRFLQNCKASGWSCLKRIHNLVLLRRITCLSVPANLIHIPELRTELKTQQSEWSMEDSPPWTCQRNRVPFLFPRRHQPPNSLMSFDWSKWIQLALKRMKLIDNHKNCVSIKWYYKITILIAIYVFNTHTLTHIYTV